MAEPKMIRILLSMLLVVIALSTVPAAFAATLQVNESDPVCDDTLGTPYCSVKAAVDASQDGDAIMITQGNYAERGITVTKDIALQGTGARETVIDGGNTAPRILTIESGAAVTLSDLTLRNGRDESTGSSVVYDGTTLISARLEGGGAIHNQGDLTLSGVAVDSNETVGYGGGILNEGDLTIESSTFSANRALHGGGVKHNDGLLTVVNSTFSGNATTESGAAFSIDGDATISSTTIFNNISDSDQNDSGHAGGLAVGDFTWGIYTNDFPTDVIFIYIKNSLISGNRDNSPNQNSPPHDCRGAIISQGYNLMTVTAGCKITVTSVVRAPYTTEGTDELHDLFGIYPAYSLDAQLGSLQDNGGPTDTNALLSGSPAIDAGVEDDCPQTDQRGYPRPVDGTGAGTARCDIGAFEYLPPAPICGDGTINGSEECDDGNTDNSDACTNTCVPATCGDGLVRIDIEECDDGTANSSSLADACRLDCRLAACGDGVIDASEKCDDGNRNNADDCLNTCIPASCGDGILHAEEECDDGDSDNDDDCLNTCVAASCGDGFVLVGIEECDDGSANSDTISDACRLDCRLSACGDGVIDSREECDRGPDGQSSDIACTETCKVPEVEEAIENEGETQGIEDSEESHTTAEPVPILTGSGCNLITIH